MSNLRETLSTLAKNLSEENYDTSLAQYRFWLDIGTAYGHVNQNQVDGDANQILQSDDAQLIHPTAHLFFRFIGDMEDHLPSRSASKYHGQSCAAKVAQCFELNLTLVKHGQGWSPSTSGKFHTGMNLIGRWANLGFVEEIAIHNHILQSLISHPKLHDHQADALVILFKLAGATFGAYADPFVLDRCFQLLKGHYTHHSTQRKLIQVCALRIAKGSSG